MESNARELRNTLGLFTTGVTLISTRDSDGGVVGMTANSFSSLSLNPPLVLWSIDLTSTHFNVFEAANRFAVNILASSQRDISDAYAKSDNDKSIFEARFKTSEFGNPVLSDSVAVIECEVAKKMIIGDHQLIVGKVLGYKGDSSLPRLAFSGGRYCELRS